MLRVFVCGSADVPTGARAAVLSVCYALCMSFSLAAKSDGVEKVRR